MERFTAGAGLATHRGGRIDIAVDLEPRRIRADGVVEQGHRAVLEAKSTLFDGKTPQQARRRIAEHRRQLVGYIGTQADLTTPEPAADPECSVTPGIIYPRAPKDPSIRQLIEKYFGEECITVVWQDQLPAELQI